MHCSNPRIRDAQDRHSPCLKDFLSSVEIVRNNHREDTGLGRVLEGTSRQAGLAT
jgi:hypothetical protein